MSSYCEKGQGHAEDDSCPSDETWIFMVSSSDCILRVEAVRDIVWRGCLYVRPFLVEPLSGDRVDIHLVCHGKNCSPKSLLCECKLEEVQRRIPAGDSAGLHAVTRMKAVEVRK